MTYTRRSVLAGLGVSGLGSAMSFLVKQATASSLMTLSAATDSGTCPFRLAVINDEITQDFEKACQIVAGDFGLRWIELRSQDRLAGGPALTAKRNARSVSCGL